MANNNNSNYSEICWEKKEEWNEMKRNKKKQIRAMSE